MPAFLQAAASSGLIGREASEMSVSPAQKRWNPPPVPATPTVMLTRGLVVAKRSAASCMSGPTVLEPSALIDPVRFEAGPAGRLTAEEPCGRPPQALAATATATATSASGEMRRYRCARVHSSRAWQRIRTAASRTTTDQIGSNW